MTRPPSGSPPPEHALLPGGDRVRLDPLAREAWARYSAEFPDEVERHGPAAEDWCVHDAKYVLAWAAGAERGEVDLSEQLLWLARVLGARDYPLERLARDLEILGDVAEGSALAAGTRIPDRLREGAAVVRS